MCAVFQDFLIQNLPIGTTAKTKQIERVWNVTVCETAHNEALRELVIDHIFKSFTTILKITHQNNQNGCVTRKTA